VFKHSICLEKVPASIWKLAGRIYATYSSYEGIFSRKVILCSVDLAGNEKHEVALKSLRVLINALRILKSFVDGFESSRTDSSEYRIYMHASVSCPYAVIYKRQLLVFIFRFSQNDIPLLRRKLLVHVWGFVEKEWCIMS